MAPRTLDSDTTPDARASDYDASNGSNTSQVLALGPALDALDSFGALESDQGRNRINLMNRKWRPGLWIQTPPPMHVPRILMHLIDRMHLKSWPWGRFPSHEMH